MKILTFGLLFLSQFAVAQTCLVDMVNRNNRVIQTFRSYDNSNSCMEGMKQCRLTIRTSPHLGGVDCIRRNHNPIPTPYPTYYPTPNPYPTPYPTYDPYPNPYPTPHPTYDPYPNPYPTPYPGGGGYGYPTNLIMGETVVVVQNQRLAQIVAQDYYGKFLIRYIDTGITSNYSWERSELAPMRGCDGDICVNDIVINASNARQATVVALALGGRFLIRYSDNGLISSNTWIRQELAVTRGCQLGLCVGSKVINVSNRRYATVVALKIPESFLIRYEDNGLISSNVWSISELAPVMGGFNF
jgi:hypothetical protein